MTLRGAVVLITGAAQGIGAAALNEFRRRGAYVSAIDLAPPPAQHPDVIWTQGDVCSRAVREEAVAATLARYGRIDVLVNNAGVGLYSFATESPASATYRIFEVNLFAAIDLTRLVVPHLKERSEAAVVNISSVGALVPLPWAANYCMSKAALHSFSRCLEHELAGTGVHVSTIIPGIVSTNFRRHVLSGKPPEAVTAIKTVLSPEQVAEAVANAVVRRNSLVYLPFRALLFAWMELILPGLMDWYIRRLVASGREQDLERSEAA